MVWSVSKDKPNMRELATFCHMLTCNCFGKIMLRTEGSRGERGSRWAAYFKSPGYITFVIQESIAILYFVLYCMMC